MNRREFLKGLMLIPAGWKTLFRKKEKNESVCLDEEPTEVDEDTWSKYVELLVENSMEGEEGAYYFGGAEFRKANGSLFPALRKVRDETDPSAYEPFQGLDKIINTGREDVAEETVTSSSRFIVGEASTDDEQMIPIQEFASGYPNVSWQFPLPIYIKIEDDEMRYCPDISSLNPIWYRRIGGCNPPRGLGDYFHRGNWELIT